MAISSFDHYTLRCADIQASRRFYEQALGLHVIDRPMPNATAAKVQIGEVDVVHLFQASSAQNATYERISPKDEEASNHQTGRLVHVGFWATDHRAMKADLARAGVPFKEWTLPDKHQLVMHDPDNTEIEVNFPLSELTPGEPIVRPPWMT
jgi:catechol 2,3-dioxygenase-like lactoylglutathione lyase family enzyme